MSVSSSVDKFYQKLQLFQENVQKDISELGDSLDNSLNSLFGTSQKNLLGQLKNKTNELSEQVNKILESASMMNYSSGDLVKVLSDAVQLVKIDADYAKIQQFVMQCEAQDQEPQPQPLTPIKSVTPTPEVQRQLNQDQIKTPTLDSLGLSNASMALLRIKDTDKKNLSHISSDLPSSPALNTTAANKNSIVRSSLSSIDSPNLRNTISTPDGSVPIHSNLSIQTSFSSSSRILQISQQEYNSLDFSLRTLLSFDFISEVISFLNDVLDSRGDDQLPLISLEDLDGLAHPDSILLALINLNRITKAKQGNCYLVIDKRN